MRGKASRLLIRVAATERSIGAMEPAPAPATTFQSTLPAQLLLPRPVHLRAAVLFAPPL